MCRTPAGVLLLAVSSPLASWAAGAITCPAETTPLLTEVTYVEVYPRPPEQPQIVVRQVRSGLLICRNGLVVKIDVNGKPADIPFWIDVQRGTASPAAMAALGAAMAATHVGQQDDCHRPRVLPELRIKSKVTWFGAGNRRNSFGTSSEVPGLPNCPVLLFNKLIEVRLSAFGAADAENLRVPGL
jgi:hypothetical protein